MLSNGRQQHWQGVLLIIMSIGMLIQGYIYYENQKSTVDCLQENFSELSTALDSRGELQGLEAEATRNVISTVARGNLTEKTFNEALENYTKTLDRVTRIRENNPLPPYPLGECN